jgi:hypothetical protein
MGAGAFLSPGLGTPSQVALIILRRLIFNADATYSCSISSRKGIANRVVAKGVSINGGLFSLTDTDSATLSPGTVFIAINNTSLAAIAGTFSNLSDGATITIGSNTFQVNYEGGDGNDLTLTVVP